jgi:hypothetical protein
LRRNRRRFRSDRGRNDSGEAYLKRFLVLVLAAELGACAQEAAGPKTVTELHQQHVWQHEPGADLMAAMETGFSRIAHRKGRAATLAQLAEAG